ncbi:group II intron reverse transcriptase/maturase [Oligoflexia bacterium]|nr:group II intron reverse transcriptase/maturase [Oligoflexia bacterium]
METSSLKPTLENVLKSNNVKRAWQRVKRNHGAPGVDGMSTEEFPEYACKSWKEVRLELEDSKYLPAPVLRVEIPKRSGGQRALGIPTVVDRVIQQAISQVLTPVFDPCFSESSFGFRPERSAQDAARKVSELKAQGYRVAVEVDLEKFFDKVKHDILMHLVAKKVTDKPLLKLIGKYLRAGVQIDGVKQPTKIGVPQGGPLSPLLSNIVLDVLDKELEAREHKFVRYADDFVILVKSERAGTRVQASITQFLAKRLKLPVNQEKSGVVKADKISFLGFTFRGNKLQWTKNAFRELEYNLKRLSSRSWGVSFEYRIFKLNQYIRGWTNYFGIAQGYQVLVDTDSWLRRRLRACLWKQWRYARTKVRELTKLGFDLKLAIRHAMSRKSYWRLSKTLATHSGLTNEWFEQQGLCSMKTIWVQIHYPS